MKKVDSIFWYRRDLRTYDNRGLFEALSENSSVLPIFIFDENILSKLKDKKDKRILYIYDHILEIKEYLKERGSDIQVFFGKPEKVFTELLDEYEFGAVYSNRDYDQYSIKRDEKVSKLLKKAGKEFRSFKDHVIFEKDEVVKDDGNPYLIYTPYSKSWLNRMSDEDVKEYDINSVAFSFQGDLKFKMPSLEDLGFEEGEYELNEQGLSKDFILKYKNTRDIPAKEDGTSRLSVALRFGAISTRDIVRQVRDYGQSQYLSEIIWRDFFHMLLYFFPKMKTLEIKENYRGIPWVKDKKLLQAWKEGKTGYPIIDAGMRQLNQTGYMHNRIRMITASFLVKILKIDWKEGEKYFAEKLLDYDQSANAGNWQWAAGSGTDAAPYFRIFNPYTQIEKFDPEHEYIKKWVPEFGTDDYVKEIVDYKEERRKTLEMYKNHLEKFK